MQTSEYFISSHNILTGSKFKLIPILKQIENCCFTIFSNLLIHFTAISSRRLSLSTKYSVEKRFRIFHFTGVKQIFSIILWISVIIITSLLLITLENFQFFQARLSCKMLGKNSSKHSFKSMFKL